MVKVLAFHILQLGCASLTTLQNTKNDVFKWKLTAKGLASQRWHYFAETCVRARNEL